MVSKRGSMKYVYILQSINFPQKCYVGITDDVNKRLKAHNHGQSPHTSKYKPWELISYSAFSNHSKAFKFEKYLKSGSGKAFASRHLK
jgi:putative endonuclease